MRQGVSFPCGCVVAGLADDQPQLVHCALHGAAPLLRTALRNLLVLPHDPLARLQALRALLAAEAEPERATHYHLRRR